VKNQPRTGTLSPTEAAALAAIYTHRVVSTGHLRAWLSPDTAAGRYLGYCLTSLRQRGLVANPVGRRGRSELLWYATATGAAVAEESGRVMPRAWRLDPDKVPYQDFAHTLAVNDVGTAFLADSRAAGDDMTELDWTHEVPHPTGRGRGDQLIADALLRRSQTWDGRRWHLATLIELDRNTMSAMRLVDKLRVYGHYLRNSAAHRRAVYGQDIPDLLIVLDNGSPEVLLRRARDVVVAAQADEELERTCRMYRVRIASLALLRQRGPIDTVMPLALPERIPPPPPPPKPPLDPAAGWS